MVIRDTTYTSHGIIMSDSETNAAHTPQAAVIPSCDNARNGPDAGR